MICYHNSLIIRLRQELIVADIWLKNISIGPPLKIELITTS